MLGANLSNILEVGIGLAFVFLVLSLIASVIGEFGSQLVALRGRTLRRGVEHLLDSQTAERLYRSPLVRGLSRRQLPSYMEKRTFAVSLLEVVRSDGAGPIAVPAASGNAAATRTLAELEAGIMALPSDSPLRGALTLFVRGARARRPSALEILEDVEEQAEAWFDTTMERVSGWYKRHMQLILFVVGLTIAAGLNVDALFIAEQLYEDPGMRASVVESAAAFTASVGELPGGVAPEKLGDALDRVVAEVAASMTTLDEARIPIGWQSRPADAGDWLRHGAGWLGTALAISLGAPFWFDLLGRLVNLRGSGPRPAGPGRSATDGRVARP